MKLHQTGVLNTRTILDPQWRADIRTAVTPANPVQAAALHYATVTEVMPLGLHPGSKQFPRLGMTGYVKLPDADLAIEEITRLTENHNLALRPPAGVIGIDIDTYAAKTGHHRLATLEADLGALPPTWSSSRRTYNPQVRSGIYWYRLAPRVMRWYAKRPDAYPVFAQKVCHDVETIQLTHRYAVAAPSVVDGMTYQWRRPDGTTEPGLLPPSFDDLPVLPDTWTVRLLRTQTGTHPIRSLKATREPGETYASHDHADDAERAEAWCTEHIPGWDDEPDFYLDERVRDIVATFATAASRYDTMRDGIWQTLHLAIGDDNYPGHPGGQDALERVVNAYLATKPDAIGDAARAFSGAVDKFTARLESGDLQPLPHISSYQLDRGPKHA